LTPASGGTVVDLTNTPDVDEEGARFSPDGSVLAFTRRPKTETPDNIAVMDFASNRVRQLTHDATKDHTWSVGAFSPDGKSILANRTNAARTESEIWLIGIAGSDANDAAAENTTRRVMVMAGHRERPIIQRQLSNLLRSAKHDDGVT
jgi:Tol biopolymer transport system component